LGRRNGWRRSEIESVLDGKASDATCRIICSNARSYKVSGVRTLNETITRGGPRLMGLDYAFAAAALTMASQLGIFTARHPHREAPTSSSTCNRVARQIRRSAAWFLAITVSACNLQHVAWHGADIARRCRIRRRRSRRIICRR